MRLRSPRNAISRHLSLDGHSELIVRFRNEGRGSVQVAFVVTRILEQPNKVLEKGVKPITASIILGCDNRRVDIKHTDGLFMP